MIMKNSDKTTTDTTKYAQYLLGDLEAELVNEIYPGNGFEIDNEFMWRTGQDDNRVPISEVLQQQRGSGATVVFLPAVDFEQAKKLARAELKRHPEKRKTARIV
jgi:hypothetical protein